MSKVARCIYCGLATPLGNPHLGCQAATPNAILLDVRTQVGRSLLDVHLAKAKAYNLDVQDLFEIIPKRDYAS